MGRLRDALHRIATPHEELEQEQLAAFCEHLDCTAIPEVEPRRYVRVAGEIRDVRTHRLGGAPSFEATISDGRGTITAVFLGRSDVPGLTAGRRLLLAGVAARQDGQLRMLNPEYRLLSAP